MRSVQDPIPSHRWLILLRVVEDETGGKRDHLEGTAARGLAWRMVDRHGVIPNPEEVRVLKVEADARFREIWGNNPTRTHLAVTPWLPADGDHPTWREPLGPGGEE